MSKILFTFDCQFLYVVKNFNLEDEVSLRIDNHLYDDILNTLQSRRIFNLPSWQEIYSYRETQVGSSLEGMNLPDFFANIFRAFFDDNPKYFENKTPVVLKYSHIERYLMQ